MTKAELLAAIAHLPDTSEIWLSSKGVLNSAECLIRVTKREIWLGDRAALAEELDAWQTSNPEKADSILWHNPAALPAQHADLAAIAVATMKTQY